MQWKVSYVFAHTRLFDSYSISIAAPHSCKVNVGLNTHELFIVSGVRFPQPQPFLHSTLFTFSLHSLTHYSLGSRYVYVSVLLWLDCLGENHFLIDSQKQWHWSSKRFKTKMCNKCASFIFTQNDFGNFFPKSKCEEISLCTHRRNLLLFYSQHTAHGVFVQPLRYSRRYTSHSVRIVPCARRTTNTQRKQAYFHRGAYDSLV